MKEEKYQELQQDMWKLALKYGQHGDTYHWTLKIDTGEGEEEFEGGCNY